MEWYLALLLITVLLVGGWGIQNAIRGNKVEHRTISPIQDVFDLGTAYKISRHGRDHMEWNMQFGPPYYYATIEDEHKKLEFIDDAEVLRRHKEFQ